MFKINRRGYSPSKTITHKSTSNFKKQGYTISKSILNKSYKDLGKQCVNKSIQKINSYKRLTKLNIKLMLLRRIQAKSNSNSNNPLNNTSNQQQNPNNQLIHNNSILPPIPKYTPNLNKELQLEQADISKLPKRTIETQEDMANLFNQIMNGTGLIPKINLQGLIEYKELISLQKKLNTLLQNLISDDDFNNKLPLLINLIKNNIIDNARIDYIKYINTITNLKKQFPKNSMIKSITFKALLKLNNQQFYKINADKLKLLILLVHKYMN